MDVLFVFIINQESLLVMMPCSLVGVLGCSIMYPNAGSTGYTEFYWTIWYQIIKDGIFVA
jgi:hypothetical protein